MATRFSCGQLPRSLFQAFRVCRVGLQALSEPTQEKTALVACGSHRQAQCLLDVCIGISYGSPFAAAEAALRCCAGLGVVGLWETCGMRVDAGAAVPVWAVRISYKLQKSSAGALRCPALPYLHVCTASYTSKFG